MQKAGKDEKFGAKLLYGLAIGDIICEYKANGEIVKTDECFLYEDNEGFIEKGSDYECMVKINNTPDDGGSLPKMCKTEDQWYFCGPGISQPQNPFPALKAPT